MFSGLSNTTVSPNTTIKIHDHDVKITNASKSVLFLFVCFTVGALIRQFLRTTNLHLPYTVVLFILGILFGTITHNYPSFQVYTDLTRIDASILMQTFLPILIFESAYSMDAHMFMKSIYQCLILALPGLIICSSLIAAYSLTVLSLYKWDLVTSFLFGSILSATDPVAVVALMKESGITPTLTTLIEGESLLNDGSAIVIFDILLTVLVEKKKVVNAMFIFLTFLKISVAAPAFGYLMGKLASTWLVSIYKDAVLEFTITLCFAYLTYYIAETILTISGVLAIVVLGVVLSSEKSSFSPETEEAVYSFWEMMSYFANTLIFIIVGVIITERASQHVTLFDAALSLSTYIFITIFRLLMIMLLSPLLTRTGYGLSWRNAIALVWGGLRGAVGLALALMLTENPAVDDTTIADKVLLQLSVVIVLTLLVNGTTMKILLDILGLNKVSHSHRIAMRHATSLLRDTAIKSTKVQKKDKFLNDANWLWVESHTYIADPYHIEREFDKSCSYVPFRTIPCHQCHAEVVMEPSEAEKDEMEEETRLRVLKSVKSIYWNYFERSIICRRSVQLLMAAANEAMDQPGKFIDVKELKRKYMKVPRLIHFVRRAVIHFANRIHADEILSVPPGLTELYQKSTGFRHLCLRVYMSCYLDVFILIITLLNIVPMVIEIELAVKRYDEKIISMLASNVVFILVYTGEAIIKIVALGWRTYWKRHWNKYAIFIIIVCLIDFSIDLSFLFSHWGSHYIVTTLRALRLIRVFEMHKLFMKLVIKLVSCMENKASSRLYLAYDLGHAYVAAQEEVLKKIDFVMDYKPCGMKPLKEAESSILEMTKSLNKIQDKHHGVTVALKSHKASMIILNDMTITLKELHEIGLIDEVEYEKLLVEIDILMRTVMRAPRTLKSSEDVKDILKKVDWITDEKLLNVILQHYIVRDYRANQTIHEVGDQPLGISVITSGVIKVTGRATGERGISLPNTDSIAYFGNKGKFFDYFTPNQCVGMLGYLVNDKYVTTATCETTVRIIHISYGTLKKAENEMASETQLSYTLWRLISLKIAVPILLEQARFHGTKLEHMKMELENAILPDLSQATSFDIDLKIRAVVLIQGKARDAIAGVVYMGPEYIPSIVRRLHLDDEPDERPRVVVLLLPEEDFQLPESFNWNGDATKTDDENLCLYHTVQHRRSTMGSILPPVEQNATLLQTLRRRSKTSSTVPLTESV